MNKKVTVDGQEVTVEITEQSPRVVYLQVVIGEKTYQRSHTFAVRPGRTADDLRAELDAACESLAREAVEEEKHAKLWNELKNSFTLG